MSYLGLLNSTCSIYRMTGFEGNYDYTASTEGSVSETWTETYTNVECRVDRASTPIYRRPAGIVTMGQTTGFFLPDQDIVDGDRVYHDSNWYEVMDVVPIYGYNALHHKEAALRLLDQEF